MSTKLVMFKPNGKRKDLGLKNSVTLIGRGDDCDLRIPIMSISRKHCVLRLEDGALTVKDLSSSNGTFVNNKRVSETQLKAGDRLAVGPIVFTVQINGMPEQIEPVRTKGQRMAEVNEIVRTAVNMQGEVVAKPGTSFETNDGGQFNDDLEAITEEETDPLTVLEQLSSPEREAEHLGDEQQ